MSSGWTLRSKWLPLRVFTEIFIVHDADPFSSLEVRQAVQTARKLSELFVPETSAACEPNFSGAINQGRKPREEKRVSSALAVSPEWSAVP